MHGVPESGYKAPALSDPDVCQRTPFMLRLSMPALLLALAGCATKPPANPDNLCEIFREKPKWHEAALKMQQRWGAPVQVPMAMMYQESSFKHDALPPRYYFLGFIPWGRVSSAYGYAQAKDETWADYKREAGGWGASRDDFADALDFMGWYIQKSQRVNGVSKWDAYGQYLNYHEGWGGYRNRSYDHWFWATVQAVSGVYLCWALSGLMMKIDWLGKAMTYIGQSTLILLIFHGEIQHKTFNLLVHLGLSEPAAASVALVISVIVSLLIGEVIKRVALLRALYFPFPVRKKAAAVQGGGEAR
ncbi:hypothetical protein IPC118_30480 [Pseudomonas aeruginosa]|nr:hypothetical protein IPC119_30470 [Pseudomonas aeruginosa]TEO75000.1 hypothetical protein IPC117_30455 [Pseudomonas aeruginosa]TEO84470.1 hypothetical protein IPC118_30480 [Pseudomonas aeruginosa]